MARTKTSARVIVFGNAKGGSGKSTCALHTAVFLLHSGRSVATIDLDHPQQTLTRAIGNRASWNRNTGRELVLPDHSLIEPGGDDSIVRNQQLELGAFADTIAEVEHSHDFVIIDTPGYETPMMRLVHGLADIIVTPVNDSFVDLDLLVRTDAGDPDSARAGPYAHLIDNARRQRRALDQHPIDWIVVQNRLSMIQSNNKIKIRETLTALSSKLDFRLAIGVSERVIFKEFFPLGVTAFDPLDAETFGVRPSMSHVAARDEFRRLVRVIGADDTAGRTTRSRGKKNTTRSRRTVTAATVENPRSGPGRRSRLARSAFDNAAAAE